jgi:hypothetical protein
MQLHELLNDKNIKTKQKTQTISNWLLDGLLPDDELIAYAEKAKDSPKATCVEALEFATKQNSKIANESVLAFVSKTLAEKAPRVKWESAKVIANIAHLFPEHLEKAIANLLANTKHPGTVVRWSAALAICEILKLKTKHNRNLLPAVKKTIEKEEQNSIRKIYEAAIKKLEK